MGDAARPAGENNPFGVKGFDLVDLRIVKRPDFAVNAAFAQSAGNQLRHLRAEIKDQDMVMGRNFISHKLFYKRVTRDAKDNMLFSLPYLYLFIKSSSISLSSCSFISSGVGWSSGSGQTLSRAISLYISKSCNSVRNK